MLKRRSRLPVPSPSAGISGCSVAWSRIENRSTTRNGVINITFSVAPGTDFRTLDLNKLRFWLGNDDNYTRNQLYLWFCEYLQGADLTVGEQHIRLPEFMLKAVGFDRRMPCCLPAERPQRLPDPSGVFLLPGCVSLFDLCGCPALPDGLQGESFSCNCVFRAHCPWTSGCATTPCACIARLPLIYLSTIPEAITLDNQPAAIR